MKNMLLIFLILPFFPNLQAQDYKPMAVDGARWIIFSITDNGFEHHALAIKGDTVFNGIVYKKIYRQDIQSKATSPLDFLPPYHFDTEYLYGFLRDDLDEQKVFGFFEQSIFECQPMTDNLLYDFSLDTGDTITGCLNADPFIDQVIVDSTSFIFLYGTNRKVIFPNEIGDMLIEGVGTTLGPFTSILGEVHPGSPIALTDYCLGTDMECGMLFTSNTEIHHDWRINVYPNPGYDYLNVEFPDDLTFPLLFRIHDVAGKLLFEKILPQQTSLEKVDLAVFPKGIFGLVLQNQNGKAAKYFVKN